jgi:uncharacterized membrane protein YphA (DoxX/SURF4 family)
MKIRHLVDRARLVFRLLAGGAFTIAGLLKMADPAKFASNIANYRLLQDFLINSVAIILPGIEVAAGLLVLLGFFLRPAALVITSMTVLFSFVILSALARGLNIECGCFGTVTGRHVGLLNLAIDLALLACAAPLVLPFRRPVGIDPIAR